MSCRIFRIALLPRPLAHAVRLDGGPQLGHGPLEFRIPARGSQFLHERRSPCGVTDEASFERLHDVAVPREPQFLGPAVHGGEQVG